MTTDYASKLGEFLPTQQELEFFVDQSAVDRLLNAFARMTTWFRALSYILDEHQTSVLLSAAHSKVIETWILMPLGLLHTSYTALRTVVDISTSYTFYYSHPVEWVAVCEGRSSWEARANIVDWHIHYTPYFREINRLFGLGQRLDDDYRQLSSYVHGVPVSGLPTLKGIQRTPVSEQDLGEFITLAEGVDENLNMLFLSVFHSHLVAVSTRDFRVITNGIQRNKLAETGIILPRV